MSCFAGVALFRRLRRRGTEDSESRDEPSEGAESATAPVQAVADEPEADDARPGQKARGLEGRLTEIADEAAPEDALELAVQVIAEECGASATALCLFDIRQNTLRLAAENGLSDEGCKKLRRVRRGDPSAWDMPLIGLLNRRAYLIERASQNRYVPTLVEERVAMGMVACVPLYDNGSPLASVILITPGRNVNERDVQALTKCFPIIVRMIAAVRRRAAQAPAAAPSRRPALPPNANAQQLEPTSERDRLRAEVADLKAELARVRAEQGVPPEVAQLQDAFSMAQRDAASRAEELERIRMKLSATETSLASVGGADGLQEVRERAVQAEQQVVERQALLEQIGGRLTEAESALADTRAREQEARSEIARLEVSLKAAAADGGADGLEAARVDAEQRNMAAQALAAKRQAEIDDLKQRLATAEAALAEVSARAEQADSQAANDASTRQAELESLRQRLSEADAALAEARQNEEQARQKIEELEASLRTAVANDNGRREQLEAAVARETELREQLESTTSERDSLKTAQDGAQAEQERLGTTLREAEEVRDRLATELETERTAKEEAKNRQNLFEQEMAVLRSERDKARASIRQRDAAAAENEARVGELTSERDRLNTRVAELEGSTPGAEVFAERDRLVARVSELEAAVPGADVVAERDRLAARVSELEAAVPGADVVAERDRLAERVAELEAAMSAAAAGTATAPVDGVEDVALREERDALKAEREGLVSDRDALAAERDALATELETFRETAAEEVAASTSALEEAETDDSVTVIPVGDEPVIEAPAIVPGRAAIVVLDGHGSWAAQTLPEHQIVALRPDLSVRDHVASVKPERLIVNLAVPGSLQALAALRANGCTTRAWGCFVEPGTDRGLALGLVEPAIAPLDPDAVIDALGDYAVRGSRVMTTGVDVDGLMSVRQALSRRRVSVSMAWDRKQAGELLSVAKPHAVLIDLDLPRDDGYGILCELATTEPVPFAVILGSHDATSPSLDSLMSGFRSGDPVLPLRDVLNTLSTRPARPTPDEELRSKRRGPARGC